MNHHLSEMARQVRGHTIRLLEAAPAEWLLWAPAGTSNHVLWHAGHSLWLGDVLGVALMTGRSELPAGWAETFGSDCRPVRETTQWPGRDEVRDRLHRQLDRLLALFASEAARLEHGPLVERVIHGLHDEARHQGEMYLLRKSRQG